MAYLYSLCKKVEQMSKLASSHTLLVYNNNNKMISIVL